MMSVLAWARRLITLVMVISLAVACVRPNPKSLLASQQDADDDHDDDSNDDESGTRAEKQFEALSNQLLRYRQSFASTHSTTTERQSESSRATRTFIPIHDRSRPTPRLFLRLQI